MKTKLSVLLALILSPVLAMAGTSMTEQIARPAVGIFDLRNQHTGQKVTYAAALTAKTATAAGTGPFFTICGSATKTIRVQEFKAHYTIATAGLHADPRLQKTSTATSAGTATALTKVPLDSNSAAATANLVNFYTVLATPGTLVGTVAIQQIWGQITATVTAGSVTPDVFRWKANDEAESVVLRGTAQCLEGSFGTTTTNAPTMTVSVVWTEE
jgi:hypothetical protein